VSRALDDRGRLFGKVLPDLVVLAVIVANALAWCVNQRRAGLSW
jgi:hypothetical protein